MASLHCDDARLSEPAGVACASCHEPARAFSGGNGSGLPVARGSKPTSLGGARRARISMTPRPGAGAASSRRRPLRNVAATAQAELGRLYKDGRGVPEDTHEAARWLRRAADAGVGIAQLNLGRMYKDGSGVPRDLTEAYAWLTLAATNGYMDAMSYRTRLQHEMTAEHVRAGERLAMQRRGKTPEPGR